MRDEVGDAHYSSVLSVNVDHINGEAWTDGVGNIREGEVRVGNTYAKTVNLFDENRVSEAGLVQVGKRQLVGADVCDDVIV